MILDLTENHKVCVSWKEYQQEMLHFSVGDFLREKTKCLGLPFLNRQMKKTFSLKYFTTLFS